MGYSGKKGLVGGREGLGCVLKGLEGPEIELEGLRRGWRMEGIKVKKTDTILFKRQIFYDWKYKIHH